jgi:hypothetical protein
MLSAAAAVLALGCGMPAVAHAQTAADMRQRISTMADSLKASQRRLEEARSRNAINLDDVLVSDGVTVRFPAAEMSERSRDAVREGIGAARQTLEDRFGAGSARLMDGLEWHLLFNMVRIGRRHYVGFATPDQNQSVRISNLVSLPIAPSDVERFVLQLAGRKLVQSGSVIGAFTGGAFFLTPEEEAFYVAQRHLAVSTSSVARRCAKGALGACRTILDPAEAANWFAVSDTIPRDRRPIPLGVNASLVTVALDLGGARAIDLLAQPSQEGNPITLLAEAAGVTPDSLLKTWNVRLQNATVDSAHPSLPLAASAVFWCGIFFIAATRRRPR